MSIRYEIHNRDLAKDLEGHDIFDYLKQNERQVVNNMTNYHMSSNFTVPALKDKDVDNLTTTTHVYKERLTY